MIKADDEVVVDSSAIISRLAAEIEAAAAAKKQGAKPAAASGKGGSSWWLGGGGSKRDAASLDVVVRSAARPSAAASEEEERLWRRWVDERFVKVLTTNIYRNWDESWSTFRYLTDEKSGTNWGWGTRELARVSGGVIMWRVGQGMPKKYGIEGDVRLALYAEADTFVDAVGPHRPFLGGTGIQLRHAKPPPGTAPLAHVLARLCPCPAAGILLILCFRGRGSAPATKPAALVDPKLRSSSALAVFLRFTDAFSNTATPAGVRALCRRPFALQRPTWRTWLCLAWSARWSGRPPLRTSWQTPGCGPGTSAWRRWWGRQPPSISRSRHDGPQQHLMRTVALGAAGSCLTACVGETPLMTLPSHPAARVFVLLYGPSARSNSSST